MGKPDLFAKRTMAEQAELLTRGGATWKEAPEIGLEKVQGDGILVVHDPGRLSVLPAPWNLVLVTDEILIEFKMQGDHVDFEAIARTLLRRQARETQRVVDSQRGQTRWMGRQTLWFVSAYIPEWALERYRPLRVAPGCYEWAHEHFTAVWIAANELPLCDELIPFLIARTGRRWEEFFAWVLRRRKPLPWLEMMLESGAMLREWSEEEIRTTMEQVRRADQEGRQNLEQSLLLLLNVVPDVRKKLTQKAVRQAARQNLKKGIEKGVEKGVAQGVEKGVEKATRDSIITVLRARNLEVRPDHLARIDACNDIEVLRRWLAGAACAASADNALT